MLIKEIYYADEWMDEFPGVAGDLDTVAEQLANGVEYEPGTWIVEPQTVPSHHKATRTKYAYVPCTRIDNNSYAIPAKLPGEPLAVAHYEGGGWDREMMVQDVQEALDLLDVHGDRDIEWLVVLMDETSGAIHLSGGPTASFHEAQ